MLLISQARREGDLEWLEVVRGRTIFRIKFSVIKLFFMNFKIYKLFLAQGGLFLIFFIYLMI